MDDNKVYFIQRKDSAEELYGCGYVITGTKKVLALKNFYKEVIGKDLLITPPIFEEVK